MTTKKNNSQKRLPRLKRAEGDALPRFRFMERDGRIVEAVYNCRALSKPQIERLFFIDPAAKRKPKNTLCDNRLRYLFHHGFLFRDVPYRRVITDNLPFIYFLDEKGRDYLAEKWDVDPADIDWKPSYNNVKSPFLDHQIEINDVRVDVTLALQMLGHPLEEWVDDLTIKKRAAFDAVMLKSQKGRRYAAKVIPDSYFRLNDGKQRFHFLLELDRGTESGPRFSRKVRAYLEWEKAGQYHKRYQTKTDMRVLVVTTTERRRDNLMQTTESEGGGRSFWFTTLDEVNPKSVLTGAIWCVAKGGESRYRILEI